MRISIFAGCSLASQGGKIPTCRQRRLKSDCADAQAEMNLRWAHVCFGSNPFVYNLQKPSEIWYQNSFKR